MKEVRIIGIILLILFYPLTVIASWSGPDEIVKGGWGKGEKEFGFRPGDIKDQIPWNFLLLSDGKIVIEDWLNNRLKLYLPTGAYLKSIVQPGFGLYELDSEKIISFKWNAKLKKRNIGIYSIMQEKWLWVDHANSFKYVSNIELAVLNRNIFIWDGKNGYQYSPTGQLLETYKERPLELGVVKRSRGAGRTQKYTVKYDDITYTFKSERIDEQGFKRDTCLNLYLIGRITNPKDLYIDAEWEGNTVSERPIPHYIVTRYDLCDNSQERLHIPANKSYYKKTATGVIRDESVLRQYGKPIVAHIGDVYCWKRSANKYSILKWTWQGPPDAPQSLKVTSLKTGLHLTWEPPIYEAKYVKEYEIVRSDEICGQFTPISTVPKNTLKYEDKDVSEGTTYCYKVSAVRASGSSEYSNKAAGKIGISQTTSMEVAGDTYLKVEKDILAGNVIKTAKLHSFNKIQLKLLRNTIFAKYGRSFKSETLKSWFAKKDWYNVDPKYTDSILTDTDKKNITTFLNFEKKK